MPASFHEPVLLKESLELLDPKQGENFIDGTLGGGGHTQAILEKSSNVKVLAIDLDSEAIDEAKKKLAKYKDQVIFVQDNFRNLKQIAKQNNFSQVDGIILDLGVSYHQIATPRRGFSYRLSGELDMRMGKSIGNTAKELLQDISVSDLTDILVNFGEVYGAHAIAEKIINFKQKSGISTTSDLTKAITGKDEINPKNLKLVSKIFQAIRIAVNQELESLEVAVSDAIKILTSGGRLVVISYHSLEDRIVKRVFQREARDCICPDDALQCQCQHKKSIKIITKKPVTSSVEEINKNKKSRSAKLRSIIKI